MTDITVLVKFKPSIAEVHLNALTALGAEIKQVHTHINWVTIKIPAEQLEKLKANADIELVELDQEAHALGFNDALKFNLPTTGQTVPWGVAKIRADQVWPEGDKGTGIKVCVIDTGIDYTHPDLKGNYRGGHNYITGSDDPKDDNGHGTHVSGIVAANGTLLGVAPEAYLFAYKVLDSNGSGSYSAIVSAINDAISNGMQIISMSLGGSGFSQALKDACSAAFGAGIAVVAAAGNSGGDGTTDTVLYPAKFSESVIAVAATDSNDVRASFSSCGQEVEVTAPGVSVVSTVPTSGTKYSDPSGYKALSGTSMATPHVSGTVALVLKAHSDFKPPTVRDTLDKTSIHLGDPRRNVFYGFGRIDSKSAVDQAPTPPPTPVLTTITVSPATASVIVGGTQQFTAMALDQSNIPMASIPVAWAVDNPTVGNVYPPSGVTGHNGTIATTFAALAAGNTVVTATSGAVAGRAGVAVTVPPQEKKFKVVPIGSPGHMHGVTVLAIPHFGDKTADEACAETCKLLKTM